VAEPSRLAREQMEARAADYGAKATPSLRQLNVILTCVGPEQQRGSGSRCSRRVRPDLGGSAHVPPHCRDPPRSGNLPIARIADQLGHSDVSMTARVYLGRDLKGDKGDLARIL
jgi:integrase